MAEPGWTLVGFLERIDEWVALDAPAEELRVAVTGQVFTRVEDPCRGVRRVEGFGNPWSGVIPGSAHGDRLVVTWS